VTWLERIGRPVIRWAGDVGGLTIQLWMALVTLRRMLPIVAKRRRWQAALQETLAIGARQLRADSARHVPECAAAQDRAIQEFIDAHQANPKPIVWTKSADEILASIARFAQRTGDARTAQHMSRTMVTGH
jgi:hypothetical protein